MTLLVWYSLQKKKVKLTGDRHSSLGQMSSVTIRASLGLVAVTGPVNPGTQ